MKEKSNNFWWNQMKEMQLFNFFDYLGWSIWNSSIRHFTLKYCKQSNENLVKADISNTNDKFESTIFIPHVRTWSHSCNQWNMA